MSDADELRGRFAGYESEYSSVPPPPPSPAPNPQPAPVITPKMDPITPRELDAKLKEAEARQATKDVQARADWEKQFLGIEGKLESLTTLLTSVRDEGRTSRWAIIGTLVAVAGIVVAMYAALPSFFESGRGVGKELAEINAKIDAVSKRPADAPVDPQKK